MRRFRLALLTSFVFGGIASVVVARRPVARRWLQVGTKCSF
jgi:hypothetical protein